MTSATADVGLRIAAVLPALNEAASISAVVAAVQKHATAIVVDDGSTDGTGALAHQAGAEVVRHDSNRGYDRALESGLMHAVSRGFDGVITLDADGQHDPQLLVRFIAALAGGADLVIGVRDRRQRWSEVLFRIVGRLRWRISDPLCGMKAYSTPILRRAMPLWTYESIGTELVLLAARSGCRMVELPVHCSRRVGASRFGSGLKANWRILRALGLGLVDRRILAP